MTPAALSLVAQDQQRLAARRRPLVGAIGPAVGGGAVPIPTLSEALLGRVPLAACARTGFVCVGALGFIRTQRTAARLLSPRRCIAQHVAWLTHSGNNACETGLMWALLFIRSSAGAHRQSRARTGYGSYESSLALPLYAVLPCSGLAATYLLGAVWLSHASLTLPQTLADVTFAESLTSLQVLVVG